MNIAIVSDSHSGISKHDITGTNISIIQIPVLLNGAEQKTIDETTSLSKFEKMIFNNYVIECDSLSDASIRQMWNYLFNIKQYDYIIHIPFSSMLNDSYFNMCKNLSKEYSGKVFVANNLRLSVSLKSSIFSAKNMAKDGYSPEEIVEWLDQSANDSSLYFFIENPKYVRNNCKLNMTRAAFDSLSKSKPLLCLDNGVISLKAKLRNKKKAYKVIIKAIEKDIKTKFKSFVTNKEIEFLIAYSGPIQEAIEIKDILNRKYPSINVTFTDQLPICLVSNLGLGVIMVGISKVYKLKKI